MARQSNKKRTTKTSSKAASAAAGTNSSPSSKENDVTIAQLEARLDDLTKQHQDLQAKHSASEQYMTDELVVNGKPKLNEAMKVKIHKVIKDLFFRSYKFVLSDKQMATVFQKILPFVFEKPLDEIPAKARQEFCVKYNDWVKFCFGERRAYVQQQLKLVAMDFREEHGKMPTLEMFCKCAKREIDFQNEEEMAAMEWYWLKVLGTVGGYTGWGDKAKFYNTPVSMTYISKAHNPNQSYKLFPATTEAFMVVMYDNCVEKWEAMAVWKEQNGAKMKLPRKSNKNKDEPIHKTKYTVSDKGQIKWAGWLDIGLQRFQELRTEIIASRAETIEIPADDDADDDTTVDAENEQDVPMTTVNRIQHFETKFLEYLYHWTTTPVRKPIKETQRNTKTT